MAERNLSIRLSVKDADTVKRALEGLGKDGQSALRKIEQGAPPASRGLLAVNAVAGDLKGNIGDLTGRLGPLGSGLSALGPLGIGAAAGIAAAVAALGILYTKGKEALSFADDIGDVADKLKITGEQLQETRFAFNGVVDPQVVDAALGTFTKSIGLAQAGNEKALKSFKALHVELKDGDGRWKSNIALLSDVADHIAALESPEEQLAITTKLFGDAADDMVTVFRNGSPALKEAGDRLREMGGLILDEDIARAGEFQQVLDDLAVVIKAQLVRGFLEVGPQIVTFTRMVGENLPKLVRGGAEAVKWLSDNLVSLAEVAATAAGAIAGGLIGSALGPLGTIIGALAGGYYGMKTAVDQLEGSQDGLNKVTDTTKRLMGELTDKSKDNTDQTREQAKAQAELARQIAATNAEAARSLWADAYMKLSSAQQAAQAKTIDVRKEFGAVVGEGGNPIVVADPKLQSELDAAAERESTTSAGLAGALEALRLADERVAQAGGIPSRTDAPVTGTAPASGIAPPASGGITPTPIGGTTNPRGLPRRLGSLGGDDTTKEKGDPFGDQMRDLQASLAVQQKLNAAYLDGGAAVGRITRELELQQKINQISAKYTPDQKAQVEQRLRALQDEQLRGKTLEKAADMESQVALAQKELDLSGETEAARNRELAILRAKLDLQKQGVDLSSEEARRIIASTGTLADTNAKVAQQRDLYSELGDMASSSVDRIGTALTTLAMANEDTVIDFTSLWAGAISELQQSLFRLALLNPLKNMLGLNGGTELPTLGGVGGLLGKAFGWIGGLFGGGGTGPAITLPTSPGTIGVTPLANATGNAFDWAGRVKAYAMGDVFDRSTLFQHAGGIGRLGEAGPEAVMPLIRLPNGNLGIGAANENAAGGDRVSVVINNNTGEKVTTKESRDGRGGRRLEVAVGDMFAQEAARPGSTASRGVSQALQGPKRR
ncbi:phage tail tape measure protein [Mycobacterium sp. KBS0706]|uniref:phage tail tape measure protein n=1 Tax=Mycobacterium sp. KBS0706 TaxID=2578109 RepID=UPI00110F872C|nr:phage tail tape measure protein [Mycobacterium sp. KBS0706]TSD89068.1 phage tail tape measure protein [Mycobacterium sp. KBS0706]